MAKSKVGEMEELEEVDSSYDNIHKVPRKQWNRWNNMSRLLFNHLYGTATKNSRTVFGTDLFEGGRDIDKIISAAAWNMAWMAADKMSGV